MDFLDSLVLGVIEGITEFLPISSTGHLILGETLLKIPQTEFLKSFTVIIQLGAILSVVVLYWNRLFIERTVWKKIIVAFLPTAAVGYALYGIIKNALLGNDAIVVLALFLGGIALIVFELWYREKQNEGKAESHELSYRQAFIVGLAQSLAVIPGVSRSAATIVGGLALGVSRKAIVEFSFFLAVPTMAAATSLDLLKSSFVFSGGEWLMLALGFVVSFLVALWAIRFLLRFVANHTFIPFGIYRIAAAALFFLFVIL